MTCTGYGKDRGKIMRIGWIGFHFEGILALQSLLEDGIKIECVISLKEEFLKKRSGDVNYEGLCKRYNIPFYKIGSINDQESIHLLKNLSLDLAFVIGWSEIIGSEALSTVKLGMIGAHASLLPHNRGSAPINWAIIKGEKETGNSLIWLAEGLDSGDTIDQVSFPITIYDTCYTLYKKVAESNLEMIRRVLPKLFNGERPGKPQNHIDEPVLPRRRPKDGVIHWENDSESIYNFVRALTKPYPGAFSRLGGKKWTIWNCALLPDVCSSTLIPGYIIGPMISPIESACGQIVGCGRGSIVLLELEGEDGAVLSGHNLIKQEWSGKVWSNE